MWNIAVENVILRNMKHSTRSNWKFGECVQQWFHWTIHVIFEQTRLNQFLAEKKPWKIYGAAKSASVAKKSSMRDRRLGMHPSDAKNYNHHMNHVAIPLTRQLVDAVMFNHWYCRKQLLYLTALDWENSRHFAATPPVSSRNEVWGTSGKTTY